MLAEVVRREQRLKRVDFDADLFGPQKDFVTDPSPLKAAVCSRRAGKTYGCVMYMLRESQRYSYAQIPYVTITRAQGKRNIWLDLQQLNERYQLGGKFNNNELTVTFPNGSVIFINGANDATEIERLRGGKYPLAVIDEAQSFRAYIRTLVDDIFEPAVSDYGGTIVMTGTPGPACAGFYYEVTNQTTPEAKDWNVHHWTWVDNPHHPYTAAKIEEIRLRKGWLPDNPTFLREYMGQWVRDDSLVVYKLGQANLCYQLPERKLEYVLGLDLGYEDDTAFVVLGYDEQVGKVWIVESWKEKHLIPARVAAKVEQLNMKYRFSHIVADTGGFGKGYAEEMKQRYGLPIEPAKKTDKPGYIELMNGDLQSGIVQIYKRQNQELVDEMGMLLFEEHEDGTPDRSKIDDRFPDHLCDAALYGWRACRQYYYDPQLESPREGSEEYWQQVEADMEAEQVRQLKRGRNPFLPEDDESGFLPESLEHEYLVDSLEDTWLQEPPGW